MTRIEKQVLVAGPTEDVLHFTRDWGRFPLYLDYIQSVKPLTENTEGLGAKLLVDLTFLGRGMTGGWETVEYDEHAGWAFTAPLMGVVARKRWRFMPEGDSTRVPFVLEYERSRR
jgi:ribosome-associated toxin RatA of RatAB toxin-antitoxin module